MFSAVYVYVFISPKSLGISMLPMFYRPQTKFHKYASYRTDVSLTVFSLSKLCQEGNVSHFTGKITASITVVGK